MRSLHRSSGTLGVLGVRSGVLVTMLRLGGSEDGDGWKVLVGLCCIFLESLVGLDGRPTLEFGVFGWLEFCCLNTSSQTC